jgi:hypothetical protein
MPHVLIKPTKEWHPDTAREVARADLVHGLWVALPDLITAAWEELTELFWGPISPDVVVPDIMSPFYGNTKATPGLQVVLRPNFTKERWDERNDLRLACARQVDAFMARSGGPIPQIDYDVDFIMGEGLSVLPDGMVVSSWPRPLIAPFSLRSSD